MGGTGLARLYYEAHITVEPYELGGDLDKTMQVACDMWDMRVSTFLMVDPTGERPRAFTSLRGRAYNDVYERMRLAVSFLKANGHTVLRYKIEDTLFDSKRGDTFDPFEPFEPQNRP
jgi:hypothetical protein